MGTSLTGTEIKDTYDSLLKISDNGPLSATAKYLSDGLGNDSKLALSTSSIGINTTSPSYQFDVNGDIRSQGNIRSNNGVIDTVLSYTSEPAGVVGTITNHPTTIWANGAERMRITSAGNVGIGTSSPAEKLSVAGAIITTGAITGHGANRVSVSQEGANGAYIQSYGANTSTVGAFTFRQASSDFSVTQIPLAITAAGNVGIGTSSPATALDVSSSSFNVASFRSSFGQMAISFANGGTTFAQLGSGLSVTATGGAADLGFGTNGQANANIVFATGSGFSERFRITNNGVTFNGDTAAANALDDYEEGTWTPVYSSTGATFTYLGQGGSYTKIGRQVLAQFYLRVTATGTLTNTVIIDGLPFTSLNSALVQNSASVWYTGTKNITPLNAVNATSINLWVNNVASPSLLLASDVASGEYIVGTLTYFV